MRHQPDASGIRSMAIQMHLARRVVRPALFLIALPLFTACQPALVPVARPTPAVLTVQSTPALQSLGTSFNTCIEEAGNAGLVLLETPADSINLQQAELALRWGASSSMKDYAAVIGQEELVIVANPRNPLESIAWSDLQAIYSGARQDWPQAAEPDTPPAEIQPWTYLNGDDARAVFESGVLNGRPAPARVVFLAPDPAAMREAVSKNPAAIGFLPRRWLDGSVKALAVEGLDPARLRQPILALSKSEPVGLEKSWLICLQERLSE